MQTFLKTFIIAVMAMSVHQHVKATSTPIISDTTSTKVAAENSGIHNDTLKEALQYFNKKDYKNAAKLYNSVLEKNTQLFNQYIGLNVVIANTEIEDYDSAFKYLNKLVKECGFTNIYNHAQASTFKKLQLDKRWKLVINAVDNQLYTLSKLHQ